MLFKASDYKCLYVFTMYSVTTVLVINLAYDGAEHSFREVQTPSLNDAYGTCGTFHFSGENHKASAILKVLSKIIRFHGLFSISFYCHPKKR